MFRLGSGSLQLVVSSAFAEQQRGFATLKDISMRLKSIKNIQKITKSMRMVAAAKFSKAERDLKGARAYGVGAKTFFDNIDSEGEAENAKAEHKQRQLIVLVTSDRGLCGGVHSAIAKEAKLMLANADKDRDIRIVCIGDKSRNALQRIYAKKILITGNNIGRAPPSFGDASIAAKAILESGFDFEEGVIIFNKFKTVVSYETSKMAIMPLETLKQKQNLLTYDSVDDDVLQSYSEYSLAQLIYYAMKESAASEQASRMTAMEGASKNA
ncbi:ATP synthase subunit gamma, partial [Trichostrongylus colubriformis]